MSSKFQERIIAILEGISERAYVEASSSLVKLNPPGLFTGRVGSTRCGSL
jgi:hypothetical protein